MQSSLDPKDNTRSWIPATPQQPCPICGKTHWCATTADGRVSICRSVAANADRPPKVDKAGTSYWVHYHGGANNDSRPYIPPPPPVPEPEPAPPDVLDRVYRALLALLVLHLHHQVKLERDRGLSPEAIEQQGYRSWPQSLSQRLEIVRQLIEQFGLETVLSVPGFSWRAGTIRMGEVLLGLEGAPGYIIPVLDAQARVVALQIRLDSPSPGRGKYIWLSSKSSGGPSCGAPVHVPLGPSEPDTIRITEGPLKANIATDRSGILTIGAPSATIWNVALKVVDELDPNTVKVAFDADCRTNPNVAYALVGILEALSHRKLRVELETWEPLHEKEGIDELLVRGGTPQTISGDALNDEIQRLRERFNITLPVTSLTLARFLGRELPSVTPTEARDFLDDFILPRCGDFPAKETRLKNSLEHFRDRIDERDIDYHAARIAAVDCCKDEHGVVQGRHARIISCGDHKCPIHGKSAIERGPLYAKRKRLDHPAVLVRLDYDCGPVEALDAARKCLDRTPWPDKPAIRYLLAVQYLVALPRKKPGLCHQVQNNHRCYNPGNFGTTVILVVDPASPIELLEFVADDFVGTIQVPSAADALADLLHWSHSCLPWWGEADLILWWWRQLYGKRRAAAVGEARGKDEVDLAKGQLGEARATARDALQDLAAKVPTLATQVEAALAVVSTAGSYLGRREGDAEALDKARIKLEQLTWVVGIVLRRPDGVAALDAAIEELRGVAWRCSYHERCTRQREGFARVNDINDLIDEGKAYVTAYDAVIIAPDAELYVRAAIDGRDRAMLEAWDRWKVPPPRWAAVGF